MAVVYSTSAGGFLCILQLQEVSYLIKSTTIGEMEQTTCPCKVKLIMKGRKLECTSVCNTDYIGVCQWKSILSHCC